MEVERWGSRKSSVVKCNELTFENIQCVSGKNNDKPNWIVHDNLPG